MRALSALDLTDINLLVVPVDTDLPYAANDGAKLCEFVENDGCGILLVPHRIVPTSANHASVTALTKALGFAWSPCNEKLPASLAPPPAYSAADELTPVSSGMTHAIDGISQHSLTKELGQSTKTLSRREHEYGLKRISTPGKAVIYKRPSATEWRILRQRVTGAFHRTVETRRCWIPNPERVRQAIPWHPSCTSNTVWKNWLSPRASMLRTSSGRMTSKLKKLRVRMPTTASRGAASKEIHPFAKSAFPRRSS